MLTFHETDTKFKIQGELFKMITYKNFDVDFANLLDKKLKFDFAKEIYFDDRALGNKSMKEKSSMRLLKSPAIMASGVCTKFSPENHYERYDRLKILLQGKQAEKNSNIIIEEIIAIVDKPLEYKCISTNKHKFVIDKGAY